MTCIFMDEFYPLAVGCCVDGIAPVIIYCIYKQLWTITIHVARLAAAHQKSRGPKRFSMFRNGWGRRGTGRLNNIDV